MRFFRYILIVSLFFFLIVFGISCFITTLALYYTAYVIAVSLINFIIKADIAYVIAKNIKTFFIGLVIIEFTLSFIIGLQKTYHENKYFIYVSGIKINNMYNLYNKLLYNSKPNNFFVNGKRPYSTYINNTEEFNYLHTYNSLGLRGSIPPRVTKEKNEVRILLLGDSFIEGHGAPDDSTIAVLLEAELSRLDSTKKYTVINGGLMGSNPVYEYQLYKNKLMCYHPDFVFLGLYENDIKDVSHIDPPLILPIDEILYAASHIYRAFSGYIAEKKYKHQCLSEKDRYAISTINNTITNFNNTLLTKNSKLFLTYIPSNSLYENYQDIFEKSFNIDINMKQEIISHGNKNTVFWPKDGHLNPAGNQFFATIFASKILSEMNKGEK